MGLSEDAIIFGFAYLSHSKHKLSFGGEGATMEITPRARAALNELLAAGYAEPAKADDQIRGREHYQGTDKEPRIMRQMQQAGINLFEDIERWDSFTQIKGEAF